MQRITPNLWFNGNAREAAEYYMSVFPDARITGGSSYPASTSEGLADFQQDLTGKDLTVEVHLLVKDFTCINAGPKFQFTEAISLAITHKDQDEIDYYWPKLSAVPESEQCGWSKDKYDIKWMVNSSQAKQAA